jgi:hypothetical protein
MRARASSALGVPAGRLKSPNSGKPRADASGLQQSIGLFRGGGLDSLSLSDSGRA